MTPTSTPTHIVLLNGKAGSMASDVASAIRARFEHHGIGAEVRVMAAGDDVADLVRQAMARSPEVIVAGGGDGTVNAVAGPLVGTAITLGVLPLGTLNHFAKDLAVPTDVEGAVDAICTGRTVRVDVGRVNGRVFLNNSSIGLYPQVVRRRDRMIERLGRRKWPAFFWAAMSVLRRYPFVDVRLVVEGQASSVRTPLLFVGNNEYLLDGLVLGERERLDAGCLSVHLIKRVGRMGLLALALRALLGRLRQAADFEAFCTGEIEVRTRRSSISVATDGEVVRMESPLRYSVEPGALQVRVPSGRT